MSFKSFLFYSSFTSLFLLSCAHNKQSLDHKMIDHLQAQYGHTYISQSHRTPAAAPDCTNAMKYILLKRNRSKNMAQLIKNGDLAGIKEMFWNSHDLERQAGRIPYSKWYRKLRRLNKSHHVPALFQTKNKVVGDIDTFSTIIKVADDDLSFNSHEIEAMDDVLKWVEHVQGYHERFDKVVEYGFEVRSTLNRLNDRVKNDRNFKKANFPKDVAVPIVGKNGELMESDIYFETLDDLLEFINEKEKEVVLTFSQNMVDEIFKKSRIYDVMIDQAVFYRRLELVMERFNSIPKAKLSDDQLALKEIIEETMGNSLNQPRRDAAAHVRKKERSAEFWATLRFWKSKRVEKDAKYKIPAEVLQQAKSVSPYGTMVKSMALLTAITTPITIIYNDNAWVQYITSSINNRFNDFIVYTLGLPSPALSACYKSERSWSIEEGSTMNSFVESHLSRYTAYQRIDSTYDPEADPEYMKKKLELQSMCLKMRLDYKSADRHAANKELLDDHGYRFAAHLLLADLVTQQYDDDELGELLYHYFEEQEVFENTEKAHEMLETIRSKTSDEFISQVQKYQEDVGSLTPRIQSGQFKVYYPSTDEFFETIDQYIEESK